MILRVGLTGGIASGKSTITRTLAALGCATIDADAVVARLYRPGNAGHAALVHEYGREILRPDGEIDRPKLANIAFTDADSARKLNGLIHPLVIEEEQRIMAAEERRFPDRDRIYVVEATLLLESGGKDRYDRIVVVDAPTEAQIERGIARGMPEVDVKRRIVNQMTRDDRLRLADYVIDNSRDPRVAEVETHRVYGKLRKDLEKKKLSSPSVSEE